MKGILLILILCPLFINAQIITTIAGNGIAGYSGDGASGNLCEMRQPYGIAIDKNHNIYFADDDNNVIRKINVTTGIITTIAGNGYGAGTTDGAYSGDGGPATAAELSRPESVAIDTNGNVYIADYGNYRIRKIDTFGIITTIAGNGVGINSGDGGLAISASIRTACDIALDRNGNLYIADEYAKIRKITASTGIITTICGNDTLGFTGDGGPSTAAQINHAYGIAVDDSFNVYIADGENGRIRKINGSTGIINTIAGNGSSGFSGDGMSATLAEINGPTGVATDIFGNLYIADYGNNVVRKINPSGIISTIAGIHVAGYSGDGNLAILAQLNLPTRVLVDGSGNIFIADFANNRIRKISNGTTYVNNINQLPSFNVYPNPTWNELTVSATYPISFISLSNLVGQEVYNHEYNTAKVQVDVSTLPSGVYFIKINGTEVRKFVKE